MTILDTFAMAMGAIFRNKVRSLLTALGIVIGVASVIAMVHLGQSATIAVTARISAMGSNLLIVQADFGRGGQGGTRQSAPSLTLDDLEAVRREILDVSIAPTVTRSTTLVWSGRNFPATVLGTQVEFFEVRNLEPALGRTFDPEEARRGTTVCLIGDNIQREIFGTTEALGQTLRAGRTSCTVIGVMPPRQASFGEDLDNTIVMPLVAVQQRYTGNRDIRQILVSAHHASALAQIKSDLEELMRQRRRIGPEAEDDFRIRDMAEIAATLQDTTRTLSALLGAIAAVSLLVGGIGIMNIMLVSVTERTREIGIRIAIGAQVRDVLVQFLVEAVTLSMLGGLLGVALGIGATHVATQQMKLPLVLDPEVMLLGFGFSVIIGVVFGFVPARKAASLNPIEALRHE